MAADCAPLVELKQPASMGDMLLWINGASEAYNDCATRHKSLAKWAKQK